METSQIITLVFLCLISIAFYIFSFRQFNKKGIPINNAYYFASKKEREEKDFSPHYKQSGVIFALLGTLFLLNALNTIFTPSWYYFVYISVLVVTILYAIISYIYIVRHYGF